MRKHDHPPLLSMIVLPAAYLIVYRGARRAQLYPTAAIRHPV
jgi:hypothetical protein